MRKHLVLALGVLVSVLAVLTVPNAWKTPVFLFLGVFIAIIEYRRIYPGRKRVVSRRPRTETPEALKIRVESIPENAPETEKS